MSISDFRFADKRCIRKYNSPTRQLTIDLSGFAKGIYFVEVVTTDLQVMRKKVVLE